MRNLILSLVLAALAAGCSEHSGHYSTSPNVPPKYDTIYWAETACPVNGACQTYPRPAVITELRCDTSDPYAATCEIIRHEQP